MTPAKNKTPPFLVIWFVTCNMLTLLLRSSSVSNPIRKAFLTYSLPAISRTMASSAASNEELKVNRLFDVSDFSAIVTGGGTGIGLMITQALVANGAKVYITGRRKEALDNVCQKYNTGPGKIIALVKHQFRHNIRY